MLEPKASNFPSASELAEMQLQQELLALFEADTQKDLQAYLDLVQNLNSASWKADIQTLYRSIHTIKGGSVTVGAEGILYVATALEDLLSHLRFLQIPPPLEDGRMSEILLEAGEILASSISFSRIADEETLAQVQPRVARIEQLSQEVENIFLPDWNEQLQLQIEFAEQGFDLVVLDLEMALAPLKGSVSPEVIALAQETILQLQEIGTQIELGEGWFTLLTQAEALLDKPEASLWQQQWAIYFESLKTCAKTGGILSPEQKTLNPQAEDSGDSRGLFSRLDDGKVFREEDEEVTELGNLFAELDQADAFPEEDEDESELGNLFAELDQADAFPEEDEDESELSGIFDAFDDDKVLEEPEKEENPKIQPRSKFKVVEKIQIPIPLDRIEASTKHLVDTVMSLRATEGFSQTLYGQIRRLVALAEESINQISDLRQLQDDFALLDNLKTETLKGVNLESYRKGYTTINRLLENILRIWELGAETEQTAQQTQDRLQQLDRNVFQLRETIQDSRLSSFRDLSFKARAILRDLTIRYGKSANLVVLGEQIQLDVRTARNLEPALLHLIRNAYDHALEPPEERLAQGKPPDGTLTLALERRGSSFIMSITDDGRGINAQAISAKAQKLGLPLNNTKTDANLLAVICQPGFTSQSQVSELSGRGVGLDVVAEQVSLLGGELKLETTPGVGTTFSLKLPVPHLLIPCMLVQVGDRRLGVATRTFAIPCEDVVITALLTHLSALEFDDTADGEWRLRDDYNLSTGEQPNRGLPSFSIDLMSYWHPEQKRPLSENAVCIYVRSRQTERGVWLIVDQLLGQSELPILPIPAPLIPPDGLMGMSLQPDGSLLPVLEVSHFVEHLLTCPLPVAGSHAKLNYKAVPTKPVDLSITQSILVVDDAALMRRRIEASLSANGYIVNTCSDGLEAWNWLQRNPLPGVLITDLEMPNMDGFSLIERCRQMGMTMPILVVSSRLAEEWSQQAMSVGASDYLTKGFSSTELLNKIHGWLGKSETSVE